MNTKYHYKRYTSAGDLPSGWDSIAHGNIFLSENYLSVLEKASPDNMECHFIGLFKDEKLAGIAVAQYINLGGINTFGEARSKKNSIKDYLSKRFISHVLILGNNQLTGQNAYLFSDEIAEVEALRLLKNAVADLVKIYKSRGIRINVISIKDFNEWELPDFKGAGFSGYYQFCTQPNMIFSILESWQTNDDYLADMNTKYRTQYNRARKKAEGIVKRKLDAEEIQLSEDRIYELYLTVAQRAAFNTFYLPKNHFEVFKQELKDEFLFYGYFIDGRLVGFNTLIKNGKDMDTYFLGYDENVQKEKMLYLNMLYDMAGYAIKKQFSHVIFARSAMEIKSSVGAKAEEVHGIIKHTNPILNLFIEKFFTYFDPKIEWKERNPFK
ncbi:MAG: GNAT family N-acetyltransferase [Flavobacterium sp.]|nr:MAG: GNAT family N-acetyltransferase [Flavobacterium sp.]